MFETTTPPQKALKHYSQAPWLLICLLFFASPLLGQSCPQPPVPEWLETQQITGTNQGDNLGATIAMNGNLMVVGSPRDSTQLNEAGSAKVFRLIHGAWQLEQQLQAPSPLSAERFGNSVDVYDNGNGGGLVVISTRPINRGNFSPNEIAVYVYRILDINNPFPPPGPAPGQPEATWLFDSAPSNGSPGSAVSVDKNFIAVGVPFGWPLGWGNDDTGHVIVMGYGYGSGGWLPALSGPETDGRPGSRFGSWVDIHNGLLVVGAPNDDNSSSEIDSGKAYVLSGSQARGPGPSGHHWAMLQELDAIDGPANSNKFGASVAISNDVIVVGAHQYPDGSGNAHVFRLEDSINAYLFEPEQILVAPDGVPGDIFGRSVAISDDTIVVGAYGDTSFTLPFTPEWGAAYVYRHVLGNPTASAWTVGRKLVPLNLQQGDRFGVAVAVSGCHIGVGASRDDDNGADSGSAFVFQSADCNPCVEVEDVTMQINVDDEDPPIAHCTSLAQISMKNLSDCVLIGASIDVVFPFGPPPAQYDGPQVPTAFIPFYAPVPNGGNIFLDIPISEAIAGDCVCLEITLHADNGSEYEVCCTLTICVEIPEETGCKDCNDNGVPDVIDIATGASLDLNNNGIPDECCDGVQDVTMQINVGEDDQSIAQCTSLAQVSMVNQNYCALVGASFEVVYPSGPFPGSYGGPLVPLGFVPFDAPVSYGDNFFLNIPILDALAGEYVCLEITLHADNGSEYEVCCTFTICVEIPEETGCKDCNNNGVPDVIDIADGTSDDLNNNGIPDECNNGIVGDTNGDGQRNIADVVTLLSYLFSGGDLPAAENADFNEDSVINIADAIALLDFLFGG